MKSKLLPTWPGLFPLAFFIAPILASLASAEELPVFVREWGGRTYTYEPGKFLQPRKAVISPITGNVLVSDTNSQRIEEFTNQGGFVREFHGNPFFWLPDGVAVDEQGNIYVAGVGDGTVSKFDANGVRLAVWGSEGSGDDQLKYPYSLAVDGDGYIYVTDRGNSRIQKISADGTFEGGWDGTATGSGPFDPICLGLDGSGNLRVMARYNRLITFSTDGDYLGEFETAVIGDIALDRFDNVYLSDFHGNRILKYDSDGTFILEWGTGGAGPGEFDGPRGMAVDKEDMIYVVDSENDRVEVFQLDLPEVLMEIAFDVRPGSCPNPLSLGSQGLVPAAILGSETLDVHDVDVSTLLLQGVPPEGFSYEDVGSGSAHQQCACTESSPDGALDLLLKFSVEAILASLDSPAHGDEISLTMTGNLLDGTAFEEMDCVQMRGKLGPLPHVGGVVNLTIEKDPSEVVREVSYDLPEDLPVQLTIYDVSGRVVDELVRDRQGPGTYTLGVNTSMYPCGVYFVRLKAGMQSKSQKLLVVH